MKEVLYILIKENDIKKISNKKSILFSLCPMVGNKSGLRIKYPNPLKTSQLASYQVIENKKILGIIFNIVNNLINKNERSYINELLKPYLDAKVSIYLYLKSVIPKYKVYKLFINGKWKEFSSISRVIIALEKLNSKEVGNIHNHLGKFTRNKNNLIKNYLACFQVYLLKKLINKKNIYILSCGYSYFMPNILSGLKKRKKNIFIYNQSDNLIVIIYIILKQIISLFIKNKTIVNEFFMIPIFNSKKSNLLTIKDCNIDKFKDKDYFHYLLNDVQKYINNNYAYRFYNNKLFKDYSKRQINAIFHTNRFPDLNSLSYNLSSLGFSQHLISHGTHTVQNKDISGELSSESLSIGMIKSKIPRIKIYSQTKLCDDYLSNKNLNFREIQPINKCQKTKSPRNNSSFNILSAGTVKQLGCRRHIFESSFEYIYCILELSRKLRTLDFDVKLTLRIRDVKNEINTRIIRAISNNFDNLIKISDKKFIADDLHNSDCLIALSSTTLEEALFHNIPSMSYGLSSYDHFNYYSDSNKTISKELINFYKLRKIEKLLKRKFLYLSNEDLKRDKNIFDFII